MLKAQNEDGVEFLEGHYKNLVEDLCFLISGYDNREDAFDYLNEVTRNEKGSLGGVGNQASFSMSAVSSSGQNTS